MTPHNAAKMGTPVWCRYCGKLYDLQAVETVARYADCTVFKTPCCGKQADDRRWKSLPDFQDFKTERQQWEMYGYV